VNAKIRIATRIINGRYIRSTVSDVPDLPVSSFSMSLIGGDKGPLESKSDLCFKRANKFRTMRPEVTFTAHSGKRTVSKPRLGVVGCPPAATARLRNAAGRRARLSVVVKRHPDAANIKHISLVLPKGVKLVRKKVKSTATASVKAVSARKLDASAKGSGGVRRFVVRLKRGAVRLTGSTRKAVRRGKPRTLKLKVLSVDTQGDEFTARASAKAKRR
jgi:hypothetical protein